VSAGPGDAERLPWLEPYREPTPAGTGRRARRGGLIATGIAGVAAAVGGAYLLGQQRAVTPAATPAPVVVAEAEPVAPPAKVVTPPVAPVADAETAVVKAKPKTVRTAASEVRVHRASGRPKKLKDRPLESAKLASVLDKQGETRAWPMMPSPGPAGQVIQLGAFTSPSKAQRAYSARSQRYPLLATLPRVIVPVATRPTGQVLYVLRLGTQTREQAQIVCRNLKVSGDHCLVIG
jgi:hypothetical protein